MKEVLLSMNMVAIVDDEDFDRINNIKWHYQKKRKTGYAIHGKYENGKQTTIRMHRLIINAMPGDTVDHVNGNGLDNRKENLRIVSLKINAINRRSFGKRSGYKGVSAYGKRWLARIGPRKDHKTIGHFKTKEEAALAYDAAATELYGDNAVLNFNNKE